MIPDSFSALAVTSDETSWEMPTNIKLVHEQLRRAGDTEMSQEIMDDYKNLLGKMRRAIVTLQEKDQEDNFTDLKYFVGDCHINVMLLLKKVPHFTHTIDVSKVNYQVLSTDGFVSQIFKFFISDNNGESTSAIVKMPETRAIRNALIATIGLERTEKYYWPQEEEESRTRGMMDQFNREIDFYTHNDIKGLQIPCVYHSQKWDPFSPGAIVMEDLCHLKSVSFFDSLSLVQVEQVCGELQILHLYSKDMSAVWRQHFHFPQGYLNLLRGLQPVVEGFIDAFPQLDPLYQRFKHLYTNNDFINYIMMHSHRDLGLPDVVCHGDLWTYNFLWHADENDNASENLGAIIDWQSPHTGSVGEDFAHMLVFCCSPEIRRRAENEILPRHYHRISGLAQYYPNFTLANFMRAYRRQVVMHALHLPFISNVMLKYKDHKSKDEHSRNAQILLDRIQVAWQDALETLETDLPHWLLQ